MIRYMRSRLYLLKKMPFDQHLFDHEPVFVAGPLVKIGPVNQTHSNWMQFFRRIFEILKTLTLCIPVLIMAGCQPQSTLEDGPDDVLFFESIGLGHYGTTREPIELVLRDEGAYQEAIRQVSPLADLPEVDFTQTMVGLIAVPTESGGYVVEVQSVERTGEEIIINYRLATPGEDCITVQALSLPFQVVIIRQTPGNVTFVREDRRYSCEL